MVLMWAWSLECAPRLSQGGFRELPGVVGSAWDHCGAKAVFSHAEGVLLILGSWWQNPRGSQGWAVPSTAPSSARWEGWAGGFGGFPVGLGSLHEGWRFLMPYRIGC